MTSSSKKKLLICGATGFLGYNSVLYFNSLNKYDITAVINIETYGNKTYPAIPENVKIILADLTNKRDVKKVFNTKYDIVLQFAASTTNAKDVVEQPWIHVTDNAIMNSLIFKEAYESGVERVIFPSCTTMYPNMLRSAVEDDLNRDTIYPKYFGVATTKVYIEDMCKFWNDLGKTKYVAIRHSNIYGPYDRFDLATAHVCGAAISKVMQANTGGKIEIWGNGEEKRDLLYIDDFMYSLYKIVLADSFKHIIYNIGYGESISVKDLYSKIKDISKKEVEFYLNNKAPTIGNFSLTLNCSRALEEFGWKPTIPLDKGLAKTIHWYKLNVL